MDSTKDVVASSTACQFQHLLEAHGLGEFIFQTVGEHLKSRGLRVSGGTIVDATIINAPSSTKNQGKRRDPEIHQTRKGNQWCSGMKGHIGVDADSKLIHSVATTSARVRDSQVIGALLHGEERGVWGDSAYRGQGKTTREVAPQAREFIQETGAPHRPLSEVQRARNRSQSTARSKVEHPFQIMKQVFGITKVRYPGLFKNTRRVHVTCALEYLFLVRKRLLKSALALALAWYVRSTEMNSKTSSTEAHSRVQPLESPVLLLNTVRGSLLGRNHQLISRCLGEASLLVNASSHMGRTRLQRPDCCLQRAQPERGGTCQRL